MKKLLTVLLSVLLVAMSLAGCSSQQEEEEETAKHYNIGVIQLIQHVALDAATEGFMDAVKEGLGEENVTFDVQNASGEATNCATIAQGFVESGYDLIMANATGALQAAAAATTTIPVLGTSVTDYATALSLTDYTGTVGGNISGTCDLAPLTEQANMIMELFPEAKTIGMLYCSAEANSIYQITKVKEVLEAAGLTVKDFAFADSNDLALVTGNACDECDVLYIPTDNTAASYTETINSVASAANTPIVAGEEGICKGCGVATLSIDYYELGKVTGEMAVEILKDGADISTMPIQFYENPVKEYIPSVAEKYNITIPEGYIAITE